MEKFGSGNRDSGWKKSDPGSGINIPDPQHCNCGNRASSLERYRNLPPTWHSWPLSAPSLSASHTRHTCWVCPPAGALCSAASAAAPGPRPRHISAAEAAAAGTRISARKTQWYVQCCGSGSGHVFRSGSKNWNLCQVGRAISVSTVVDNIKVWGIRFGLPECLIFQSYS